MLQATEQFPRSSLAQQTSHVFSARVGGRGGGATRACVSAALGAGLATGLAICNSADEPSLAGPLAEAINATSSVRLHCRVMSRPKAKQRVSINQQRLALRAKGTRMGNSLKGLVAGALCSSTWAWVLCGLSACAAAPEVPVKLEQRPNLSSSGQQAVPVVAEAVPDSFSLVATLLSRARTESGETQRKTLRRVKKALAALTGSAGRPVVVASVKNLHGREEVRLLPHGDVVEVVGWANTGMRIAAPQAVVVGDSVLSFDAGALTLFRDETTQLTAEPSAKLSRPAGEERFVLVQGQSRAFVVDTQAGTTEFESPAMGTLLHRTRQGTTYLLHRTGDGPKRRYARVELPAKSESASWAHFVAAGHEHVAVAEVSAEDALAVSVIALEDSAVLHRAVLPSTRSLTAAVLSADASALASLEPGDGVYLLRFPAGRAQLVTKASATQSSSKLLFTKDGQSLCVDAPGEAKPKAKVVPGAIQRCYPSEGLGLIAHLPQPPPGWTRVAAGSATSLPENARFETISRDGTLVAAILSRVSPTGTELSVAVYDAATARQLWNQYLPNKSLDSPIPIWFSDDVQHLVIDGIRVRAQNGEPVDGVPGELGNSAAMLKRFDLELGASPLDAVRLGFSLANFPQLPLVQSADLSARGLSVFLDSSTGTLAVMSKSNRRVAVFAPGKDAAVAYLPDGSFAVDGEGSDLACQFGQVLAPVEVCLSSGEVSPSGVGTILRNVF
jgi:hypothetical protein